MFLAFAQDYLPVAVIFTMMVCGLWLAHILLIRRHDLTTSSRLPRQLILLSLTILAVVVIVLSLPIDVSSRNQLLALLGLVLTAMLTLSSTTFVSNVMAGLMQRVVKSFQPGDFIRVENFYGRVTEQGLFHTEIQTTDRDLVTLPNLFLAVNPLKVTRATGTVVSCEVSLGYDISHRRIESLLSEAATAAGLSEPFVRVLELGDFSITYQAAGFFSDLSQLLTVHSRLRSQIIDHLHDAGIEIVSPQFVNQYQLPGLGTFIAPVGKEVSKASGQGGSNTVEESSPEAIIFDKAERAGKIELMIRHMETLSNSIKEAKKGFSNVVDPREMQQLDAQITVWEERLSTLNELLDQAREHHERD